MGQHRYELAGSFDWPDFVIIATTSNAHVVDFKAYEVIGTEGDDGPLIFETPGSQTPFPGTTKLEEAAVYVHGDVKWDGCSNWHFDHQDEVMLHFCDKDSAVKIGALLGRMYDIAKELMPDTWHERAG